jgi:hypothetical protein
MEMGKLTAKLRDAVPVCFLVEGKEIKRYKNIDIPDELKKLEYQGFKFDVPTIGPITFKISFAPGILPEEFPKERARSTRTSKDTPVVVIGETPDVAPSEKAIGIEAVSTEAASEPTQETTALIIIEEAPVVEILENATLLEGIEDSAASPVEVQATKETTPEAKTEPGVKVAMPTRKTAAKPKKTVTTTTSSKG